MIPPPPGQQATTERHAALTPLHRVFPMHQSDPGIGDDLIRHGWGVLHGQRRAS